MYEEIPKTFNELYRFNLKNFQKLLIDIINVTKQIWSVD